MSSKTLLVHLTSTRLATAVLGSSLSGHTLGAVSEVPIDAATRLPEGSWDRVVVTLAPEAALYRLLELPFRDRSRLAQAIGPVLEEHVPLALEEGRVAFDRAGERADGQVLAAIARHRDLDAWKERVAALGAEPTRVLWAAPLVVLPYRRAAGNSANFSLVDASADGAVVATIRQGAVVGLRVIGPTGDEHLARAVARALRALPGDTETLWLGGSRAALVEAVAAEALPGAARKRLDDRPPLDGGEGPAPAAPWSNLAALAGLALAAAGEAEAPVIDFSENAGAGIAEALGELRPLAPWAAALALVLALGWGVETWRLFSARSELETQAENIYAGVMKEDSGGVGRRLRLEMRLSELSGRRADSAGGASPLAVLAALSDVVPDDLDVELDEYRHNPDSVKVRGRADSFETVTRVEEVLRGSRRFGDVEVRDVHATAAGDGVEFQMLLRPSSGERP